VKGNNDNWRYSIEINDQRFASIVEGSSDRATTDSISPVGTTTLSSSDRIRGVNHEGSNSDVMVVSTGNYNGISASSCEEHYELGRRQSAKYVITTEGKSVRVYCEMNPDTSADNNRGSSGVL
jgi:hypothetical protein